MDGSITEYLDDRGKPVIEIKSPKKKGTFLVYKTEDGFPFFGVKIKEGGVIPKELSGQYTKLEWAKDAVVKYLEKSKESNALQRDKKTEAREKAKV